MPLLETAVLLASLVVALLATPLAWRLATRVGAVEALDGRKIHRAPTPYLGGVAIYVTLWVVVGGGLLGAWLLQWTGAGAHLLPDEILGFLRGLGAPQPRLLAIAGGATLLLVVGLLDDLRGLSVRVRFVSQFAAAGLAMAGGVLPEILGLPAWACAPVTLIWIVGMTNAFNFIDGMDGLCAGVAAIAAGLLAVHMHGSAQPVVALFLLALVGALLGFLRWNFTPARIFLGNAGAMLLGYLLSVMSVEGAFITLGSTSVLPAILPLLVLGVPLYDAAAVISIRWWHGRSPFAADTNHLHHRLKRTGMSDKQVVLFIYLLALSLGINATLLPKVDWGGGLIILAQVSASLGLVVILERIIASQRGAEDRLAACPVTWGLESADGRPVAGAGGTGRARHVDPLGGLLEPGLPLHGDLAELFGGRCLVRVRLADAAPEGPFELVGRVRAIALDRAGAQELRLEWSGVSAVVRRRLLDLIDASAPEAPAGSAPPAPVRV